MKIVKTTFNLSQELNIHCSTVRYRAKVLGFKTKRREFIFNKSQALKIAKFEPKVRTKKEEIFKYYPLKTMETFYIYESKINNK